MRSSMENCSGAPARGARGATACARWVSLSLLVVLAGASGVWAHTDPAGSNGTGVTITITAFLADQTTPAVGTTLTECESIFYRATIAWAGGSNAAFEGGVWTLTTPDGVVHNVTPVGGIPCIGGTVNDPNAPGGRGQNCLGSPTSINSALVPYTVNPAHVVGGLVLARTDLAGAFAHIGANDLAGVGAFTPISLPVAPCGDNLFCTGSETCNPNLVFGTFDERRGGCVPGTVPCSDTLFCQDIVCNEEADRCDTVTDPTPPCTDTDFCTDVVCNEATNSCDSVADPTPPCTDTNFCTDVVCNEATNSCDSVADPTPPCTDTDFCTDIVCNEATNSCDPVADPTPPCADNDFCTDVVCNEATNSCDPIADPTPPCTDTNFCTDVVCNEATNSCDPVADPTPPCTDTNFCTDIVCNEEADRCDPVADPTPPCVDNEFCATVTCNEESNACDVSDISDQQCPDNPENECVNNTCDEGSDQCVEVPAEPLPPSCDAAICRTPGFWGTHAYANPDKPGSQNITQAVIDAGGGCLNICGELIQDTEKKSADSALEAICVPIKGEGKLQLARQLTAAALNCIISGGGADCAGTGLYTQIFGDCDAVCIDPASTKMQISSCIGDLDCLNNGGIPLGNGYCQTGTCAGNQTPCKGNCSDGSECVPLPGNCHDRVLVNESLGLDFDPPGPAGSSSRCNSANENTCKVIPPGESNCQTGTKDSGLETCP